MAGRRPNGVAIAALALVIDAILVLGQIGLDTPYATPVATLTGIHPVFPGVLAALAAVRIVVALGLWTGRRWAWVLAMVLVGMALLISLRLYWLGQPPYAWMAVDVVLAFYLNQGAVRAFFERRPATDATGIPGSTGAPGVTGTAAAADRG